MKKLNYLDFEVAFEKSLEIVTPKITTENIFINEALEFVKDQSIKKLIQPTKERLYKFSYQEFEFLTKKRFYKKSFNYLMLSLIYSPHKIKTLMYGIKFLKNYY
jgi:hypothetical protein